MSTTYYSDTAGSNTAPYDTWPKAATDPQTIIDLAVAGDTCYYRGAKTLTVLLDIDTNSGSLAAGYIKHIGCNAAGVNDGTYYTLNGNGAVANCIKGAAKHYHWFENFEFKLATGNGVSAASACSNWFFKNCYSHNNGANGYGASTLFTYATFLGCRAESNTGFGFQDGYYDSFLFCKATNNGNYGFFLSSGYGALKSCLSHNNTTGQYYPGSYSLMTNCIADGWTGVAAAGIGINIAAVAKAHIANCRITNNATGISVGAVQTFYDFCGLFGNTTPTTVVGGILIDGGHNTNMAADGYVGGRGGNSADNFNLLNGATPAECRWTLASLGDAVNYSYIAAGLAPNPDFPAVGDTRETDSTDGVTGTQLSNKILKSNATGSGAGNYNDDNLAVGNIRPVAFGLAQTGTLANLDGTEAAFTALEATRNKFNTGTTEAHVLAGHSVKLANVDHNGTSDKVYSAAEAAIIEALRNTALSMAVVKKDEPVRQFGIDDLGEYDVSYPVVSAPVLTGAAFSSMIIDLDWTSGIFVAYWKLKRKTTGAYAYVGGDVDHKYYVAGYSDTALTPGTPYTYQVEAYNGNGAMVASNELTRSTFATASVPLTNSEGELLISIRAAILEIEDSGAEPIFASKDVVIGEFSSSDVDEAGNIQKDIMNREPEDFPCVEIYNLPRSGRGEGYESQRQIKGSVGVRIALHEYKTTVDRVTGKDIKSISLLSSAILRQMFRLTDRAAEESPPCPGFLMTLPEFDVTPAPEIISQHINSSIIDVNFRVDQDDTEL